MNTVLLLNSNHQPLKIIPWQRAVCLLLEDKVRVVETYAGKFVRASSGLQLPWPAVVALKAFAKLGKKAEVRVRFKRGNVLARDSFRCQYCGTEPLTAEGYPDTRDLTIDHVIPRAQSENGLVFLPWAKRHVPVSSWLNVVAACKGCNGKKADRTPSQAGMKLIGEYPRRPTRWDVVRIILSRMSVPDEWEAHLATTP